MPIMILARGVSLQRLVPISFGLRGGKRRPAQ
jgi:hypothetical protein